ncbi:MAG: hypothetical protein MJK15_07080 [Colwellia sp.]|nr:hypothetical protein [Colwellia sp.]
MKIKHYLILIFSISALTACSSQSSVDAKPEGNIAKKIASHEGKYERLQRENYFSIENEVRNNSQRNANVYIKNLVMDLVLKLAPYTNKTVILDTSSIENTSYPVIKDETITMVISLLQKELTEFGLSVDKKRVDNNHIKTVLEIQLVKDNNKYNMICFIKRNNSNIIHNVTISSFPDYLIERTKDGIRTY